MPWLWNEPATGIWGSCRIATVQSAYFGRRVNGLMRSTQRVLELKIEVMLLGWVIDRLGGRLAVWDIGEAYALMVADGKRIKK